ncbi:condensation domain-containing protein [Streptomyces sp. NPDC091279]|uniref:phthiocerol/phthiodiolone dimycocerosyl transferase family protein n=1 Tax=unclassified Streptomyces TaxID=2593676 RepID=UPI0037FDECA3
MNDFDSPMTMSPDSEDGESRALCPLESLYLAVRDRIVVTAVVEGDVDKGLLAWAFTARVAQHAALRCRIDTQDGRPVFRPLDPAELPVLTVRPGGFAQAEEERNTPMPVGGPLVRAVLLSDGRRHLLVLSADHVICDGRSLYALHADVWETYGQLAGGGRVTVPPPQPLSPSLSRLLPPSRPEDIDGYRTRLVEQIRRQPVAMLPYEARPTGSPPATVQASRVLLQPGVAAALLRRAREAGVSSHSLIGAALLLTVRRRLDRDAGPLTLALSSPVDLRGRLRPTTTADALVVAVAPHTCLVTVDRDSDPVELAQTIGDDLRGFIHRGEHVYQARLLEHLADHPELMTSTVLLSSLHAYPAPRLPAGLRLTDLRTVFAFDQYYPETGRGGLTALVLAFEGHLAVELAYGPDCFSDEQIEEIRGGLRDTLTTWAEQGL